MFFGPVYILNQLIPNVSQAILNDLSLYNTQI